MARRKRMVTQEQYEASLLPKGGRPRRKGPPNLAPLGVSRGWLITLEAVLHTIADHGLKAGDETVVELLRDTRALIADSLARSQRQSEVAARTIRPANTGGRVSLFAYRVTKSFPDEPKLPGNMYIELDIAKAAEAIGMGLQVLRNAMSRGKGFVMRERWVKVERTTRNLARKPGEPALQRIELQRISRPDSGTEHAAGTEPEQTPNVRVERENEA